MQAFINSVWFQLCVCQVIWESAVDVSTNAVVNHDASSLLYRPAEAARI